MMQRAGFSRIVDFGSKYASQLTTPLSAAHKSMHEGRQPRHQHVIYCHDSIHLPHTHTHLATG